MSAELCLVVPTRVVVLTNDTVIELLLGVALLATASSYTVMEIKYHICSSLSILVVNIVFIVFLARF